MLVIAGKIFTGLHGVTSQTAAVLLTVHFCYFLLHPMKGSRWLLCRYVW